MVTNFTALQLFIAVYHCISIICIFTEVFLISLVLNSRDWSEIIWLPRNSHFKINLPIGLYLNKPAGMHWLGRNDAVQLNKAKTRIFQPTAKFKNFETNL